MPATTRLLPWLWRQVAALLWTAPSQFELAEFHFYGALARAGHCEMSSAEMRLRHLEALAADHRQLELWAKNCPETLPTARHWSALRSPALRAATLDAMRLYEEAIQSAREHGFVQNEGLAHEVAAQFYAARGFETIAARLFAERAVLLSSLGRRGQGAATRTVPSRGSARTPRRCRRPPPMGAPVEQLDIGAVVKASQAVSGEIVLDRLIETLMTIALEHAGAERGLLVLLRGDTLQIEAEARTDRHGDRGHAPAGAGDTGRAARNRAPHRDPDAAQRDPG